MNVETIIREYIQKSLHLSLATTNGDRPWVSEVHFVYDENLNLYWRSTPDRRHSQEIAINPYVAGDIVAQHNLEDYPHAIYFEGEAELLTSASERKQIFPAFRDRLGADEAILTEANNPVGHQFYKVVVKTWYAFGKFGGDSGQKYELAWNGGRK